MNLCLVWSDFKFNAFDKSIQVIFLDSILDFLLFPLPELCILYQKPRILSDICTNF